MEIRRTKKKIINCVVSYLFLVRCTGMFQQVAYIDFIFEFFVSMLITRNITQLQDEFRIHLSLPLFRRWFIFFVKELIIYILKLKSWLIDSLRRRVIQFRIVMSASYDIVLSFTSTTSPHLPHLPHLTFLTSPSSPHLPHPTYLTSPTSSRSPTSPHLPQPNYLNPTTSPQLPHPNYLTPTTSPQLPHPNYLTPTTSPQLPHPNYLTPTTLL